MAQPVSEPERVSLELEVEPPQSVWHGKAAQLRKGPRPGHPQYQLEAEEGNSGAHSALNQESWPHHKPVDALSAALQGTRYAQGPGIGALGKAEGWTQLVVNSCDGPCSRNGTRKS